jgi:hypothetical protein
VKKIHPYQDLHLLKKTTQQLQKLFKSGRFQRLSYKKRMQWQRKIVDLKNRIPHLSHLHNIKKVIAASSLVLSLFYGNAANAQPFAPAEDLYPIWNIYEVKDFADIDGDGDLDVFTDQKIFLNSGTASVPRFSGEESDILNETEGRIATIVDIDDDGDLDLFKIKPWNTYVFYENTGTPTEPIFSLGNIQSLGIADTSSSYSRTSMTFEDMDNDGDLDFFVIQASRFFPYTKSFVYHENFGTPSQANFSNGVVNPFDLSDFLDQRNDAVQFTIADFDNDGDADIITVERYGNTTFIENVGTPSNPLFTPPQPISINTPDRHELYNASSADIDNDGDIDLIISSYFNGGYSVDYTLSFVENTTVETKNTRPFAGISTVQLLENETYHFKASDFDFSDADSITLFHHIQIKTCPKKGQFLFKGKELKFNDLIFMNEINELTYRYPDERTDFFTFMVSDGKEYNQGVRSKCILKVVEPSYRTGISLKIFPNPAEATTTTFAIKSEVEKTATLVIQDAMGKIINQFGLTLPEGEVNIPIDIPHLQSGVYFVTIRTNEGLILTERLIVQ